MIKMLANTTVVVTLQYINVLHQHIVHLKLTQRYMPIPPQFFKKRIRHVSNNVLLSSSFMWKGIEP